MAVVGAPIIFLKLLFSPDKYVIEGSYTIRVLKTVSDTINPNQLAIAMAVLSVIVFSRLIRKKDLVHLLAFACLIAILLFLKSRTSFFSTLFICGCYFLQECRLSKKVKSYIFILAALVLGLLTFSAISSDADTFDYSDSGKQMTLTSLIQSNGNGRFLTWAIAFSEIIPGNAIHGIGVGTENYEAWGYERDADNLFVDLLTEIGIPGFVFFFLFYLSLMSEVKKRSAKLKGNGKVYLLILALMLLCGIGETLFDSAFLWMVVLLCFFFVQPKSLVNLSNNI